MSAPAAPTAAPPTQLPPEVLNDPRRMAIELGAALERAAKAEQVAKEHVELLQRLQAEFENFKKRARKEKEEFKQKAAEALIVKLLDTLDNFERAMRSGGEPEKVLHGVSLIHKQFTYALEQEGLQTIPSEGAEFDPTIHDAVAKVTSTKFADRMVVEEISRGYRLLGKVLRPARVKVNILDKEVLQAAAAMEAEQEAQGATPDAALSVALTEALKAAEAAKVRRQRKRAEADEERRKHLEQLEVQAKELEDLARASGASLEAEEPEAETSGAETVSKDTEDKEDAGEVTNEDLVNDILGDL